MNMKSPAAIVMAAGLGTRMRSRRAKVLHELGGMPLIARSLRTLTALSVTPIVVVVGHQAGEVESTARLASPVVDLCFAIQPELRGTGDSARCGLQQIPNNFSGPVLLIYGDLPLVTSSTLAAFCSAHRMSGASLSL